MTQRGLLTGRLGSLVAKLRQPKPSPEIVQPTEDAERRNVEAAVEEVEPSAVEQTADDDEYLVASEEPRMAMAAEAEEERPQSVEDPQMEEPQPEPPSMPIVAYEERAPAAPEPSHETNYLYIQMNRSFRRTTKQAFLLQAEGGTDGRGAPTALLSRFEAVQIAMGLQNMFHNLTLIIQGFLAGLAVGHAFFAFVFADPDVLARGYQWMAMPAQALFYFFFTMGAIDALDRFEFGLSLRATLLRSLALQGGGLGVLIWAVGCICSVMMTPYDEYLASADSELLEESDSFRLNIWRWMSVGRAVCASLGWLLLALNPSANYTRDHLANFMVRWP